MNDMPVHSTPESKKPDREFIRNEHPYIRFRTPDDLHGYLENIGERELVFRVHPISGAPETFYYNGREKVVIREKDRRSFETMQDFLCYAFQCDTEGYTHTEYVDVMVYP